MNISSERLCEIYGENVESKKRYEGLEKRFYENFGEMKCEFFTSPGRTEIVGNHTDHNGGKVIAGSISMDTIAAAAASGNNIITIISEEYGEKIVVDLDEDYKNIERKGTKALIVGISEGIKRAKYSIKGFSAYVSTNVIGASGVSSSASFEMLICSIVNYLFNENRMSYIDYAKIGQYAENIYWNKASGLMDQLACAVGGVIHLDFAEDAKYKKIDFDLKNFEYEFVLVNSDEDHAELSEEYSSIPKEMKSIANLFDEERLAQVKEDDIIHNISQIKDKSKNKRAILRSIHFCEENKRVDRMTEAMKIGNVHEILNIIRDSGNSSWKYLQNCYVPGNVTNQDVALNLAISEVFNEKHDGVCRVHGGGFSGVIVEVVKKNQAKEYIQYMSDKVGKNNIYPLHIRKIGAVHV